MTEAEINAKKLEIIQFILDCNDKKVLRECERILKEAIKQAGEQ